MALLIDCVPKLPSLDFGLSAWGYLVPFAIRKLHSLFAAEVSGIDLANPVSEAEVSAIHAGMDEYAVLVFHDQPLTDDQQIAFSKQLGFVELATNNVTREEDRRIPIELADISNLAYDGQIIGREDRRQMFNLGNQLWHSDASFKAIPAKYSLLSARSVPSAGGNTEFADMRAAYDALDEVTRSEVEDLVCEHSLIYSRAMLGFSFDDEELEKVAPVKQRLVRRNKATGRKSLFLASHIGGIIGWPRPEALAFVRDLIEHATQRQFVYAHEWRVDDLVIWDNRQVMHRGRRYRHTQEVRDLRRATLRDDGPTVEQVGTAS